MHEQTEFGKLYLAQADDSVWKFPQFRNVKPFLCEWHWWVTNDCVAFSDKSESFDGSLSEATKIFLQKYKNISDINSQVTFPDLSNIGVSPKKYILRNII